MTTLAANSPRFYDAGGNRTKKTDIGNDRKDTYSYDIGNVALYGSNNNRLMKFVTTNVSGIPYLMRDRENALVIDPQDTKALISAIEAVATQPELRKRLITQGMGVVRPVLATDPGDQLMALIQDHRD